MVSDLPSMLEGSALRHLDMSLCSSSSPGSSSSNLGNGIAAAVAQVLRCKGHTLEWIDVSRNGITEVGAAEVVAAMKEGGGAELLRTLKVRCGEEGGERSNELTRTRALGNTTWNSDERSEE